MSFLLNSYKFGVGGGGGNPELLIDPGFDNASLWALNTGHTISGSTFNVSGASAFNVSFINPVANASPVGGLVPHTVLLEVGSANSLGFKFYFEEYDSGNTYLRDSTSFATAALTPGTKTYSYTPGASCAKVVTYLSNNGDAGLVCVITGMSLKVT